MKIAIINAAVLAAFLLPSLCTAAPIHRGPYVSGFIGAGIPLNEDATTLDFTNGTSYLDRVEFDPGLDIGGTAGYDFGGIRLEGEISYKYSTIRSVTQQDNGFRFGNVDGSMEATAMMLNTFLDLHNRSQVTPYLGGGIGFAVLHLSDVTGVDAAGPLQLYSADDDTQFAYQAGAGLEFALNWQYSVDVGYRYFATTTGHFGDSFSPTTTDLKFESHNAVVGFRVKF